MQAQLLSWTKLFTMILFIPALFASYKMNNLLNNACSKTRTKQKYTTYNHIHTVFVGLSENLNFNRIQNHVSILQFAAFAQLLPREI